jgi:hypothetical protein
MRSGFSGLSSSTDPYNRSYEDDRRNMIESIRSILLAKVDAIEKLIQGVDLQASQACIKEWHND